MYDPETFENVEQPDDLTTAAQEVVERIDFDHLRDRCEGRGGGLRSSKPQAQGDTAIEQYVWRMARFHSNANPSIPVTAPMDLQIWLDDQGIDASVTGVQDEAGEEIEGILDFIARLVVKDLGGDPFAGTDRWRKALYG